MASGSKLAEAISKGAEAINSLVLSGEIEELRDIICLKQEQEDCEDYLQDKGEIDYSKIPEIDLPAPLASSKFSQNPELLKVLNRGGKHNSEHLVGWSDGLNDSIAKTYQPASSGMFLDNHQQCDKEIRFFNNKIESTSVKNTFNYLKNIDNEEKNISFDDNILTRRTDLQENIGSRNIFEKSDIEQIQNEYMNCGNAEDKSSEKQSQWLEQCVIKKTENTVSRTICDANRDGDENILNDTHLPNISNHHNMQNINPNMPMRSSSFKTNIPENFKATANFGLDVPKSQVSSHRNMQLSFQSNIPPPQMSSFSSSNFRPLSNNFHSNVHFRQTGTLLNQSGFHFSGPSPSFRPPNDNFDRNNFGGSNFQTQSPSQHNTGNSNDYNSNNNNHGPFSSKIGHNHCNSICRPPNDNNRTHSHNRGRGMDNDSAKIDRSRDDY
ncbi:probable cyclin-dependent serine/threonine-protein kinase DDB_G0292550 [Copidosoma floridanum]|uniref:probable cyclin-dependent serine/threonine-protein kinase DDB_G0292550 n=1 Tax=Copidosoma floridanum TaxID=29053 RepID=UPI0006C9632B|nr:probable cyclin-dependent serine/threonine-protein kinase DDB_G0292550 [Copidosoma floridanum]